MRPRYGIDAPGWVIAFFAIAVGCGALSQLGWLPLSLRDAVLGYAGMGLFMGLYFLFCSLVLKIYWLRPRLLRLAKLQPGEQVLDLGCGRGLLAVGAALAQPAAAVTGVDLWLQRDQSGNSQQAAEQNASDAGVSARIRFVHGDMRQLPFPAASFDVVVSNAAIHNVPHAGQPLALEEMLRVLKPGGRFVVCDIGAWRYRPRLHEAGATDLRLDWTGLLLWFNSAILTGRKAQS